MTYLLNILQIYFIFYHLNQIVLFKTYRNLYSLAIKLEIKYLTQHYLLLLYLLCFVISSIEHP